MKQSTYKALTATICTLFSVTSAIWSVGAVMVNQPQLAIGLGVLTAFFWLAAIVQLQDRRYALKRERRNSPRHTDEILYQNMIRPDWSLTTNQPRPFDAE